MSVPINELFEKTMTPEERQKARERGDQLVAEYMTLQDLRKARELTQVRLAELLGITQKNVSQLEHRSDAMISTLRSYIEAMGGSLNLVVEFPDRAPLVLDGFASADEHAPSSSLQPGGRQ